MERKIAIIGHGNQARAWAQNLRDSGFEVAIFLRTNSPSIQVAKQNGFPVYDMTSSKDLNGFDYFALLCPDHLHEDILKQLSPYLQPDKKIIYAHGFGLSWLKLHEKFPQWTHLLLAPKAIATELRKNYVEHLGLGAVISVEHSARPDEDRSALQQICKDLGITAGPYEVTCLQETDADLFSEQALLCSILPYVPLACFNLARKKGIPAELAYFEMWYEMKLIVDTLMKIGPQKFFEMISPNAFIGSQYAKKILLGDSFSKNLEQLMERILNKDFKNIIDSADVNKEKNEVSNFWQDQELQQLHQKMAPLLFPEQGTLR